MMESQDHSLILRLRKLYKISALRASVGLMLEYNAAGACIDILLCRGTSCCISCMTLRGTRSKTGRTPKVLHYSSDMRCSKQNL